MGNTIAIHILVWANFAFLVWLGMKFLYPLLSSLLEKNCRAIEDEITGSEKAERNALNERSEWETRLNEIAAEIEQIMKEARLRGDEEYKTIVAEAEQRAEKLRSSAKKDIDLKFQEAREQLRKEIALLSVDTAEKLIKEQVTESHHKKIIDGFFSPDHRDTGNDNRMAQNLSPDAEVRISSQENEVGREI